MIEISHLTRDYGHGKGIFMSYYEGDLNGNTVSL